MKKISMIIEKFQEIINLECSNRIPEAYQKIKSLLELVPDDGLRVDKYLEGSAYRERDRQKEIRRIGYSSIRKIDPPEYVTQVQFNDGERAYFDAFPVSPSVIEDIEMYKKLYNESPDEWEDALDQTISQSLAYAREKLETRQAS